MNILRSVERALIRQLSGLAYPEQLAPVEPPRPRSPDDTARLVARRREATPLSLITSLDKPAPGLPADRSDFTRESHTGV